MKSKFSGVSLALGILLFEISALASNTRTRSMGDVGLILRDQSNIWLFPSTMVRYSNIAILELGGQRELIYYLPAQAGFDPSGGGLIGFGADNRHVIGGFVGESAVGYNNTILSTTDGGNRWQLSAISTDSAKHCLGVYFVDHQAGWVFNNYGEIFHTQNAGVSWELQMQDPQIHLSQIFFVDRFTGFAASLSPQILLKTTDGGKNWQTQQLNIRWATDIYFVDAQNGWIATTTGLSSTFERGAPVFRTSDGGLSWACQDTLADMFLKAIHFVNERSGWVVGTSKIFHTPDGGGTWNVSLETDKALVDLSFVDELHGWALGFQGEVFRYER